MKFVVFLNAAKQYAWRLKAANGLIIANGEAYAQKASCLAGIKVFVGLAWDRYFFYQDTNTHWRWRARALNSEIVAQSSEGYVNKTDCEAAAKLAYSATSATPVEDQTQPGGVR